MPGGAALAQQGLLQQAAMADPQAAPSQTTALQQACAGQLGLQEATEDQHAAERQERQQAPVEQPAGAPSQHKAANPVAQSMSSSEYDSLLDVLRTITQTGMNANNHHEALVIVSSVLNINLQGSMASDAFLNALQAIVKKGLENDARSAVIILDSVLKMKMPHGVAEMPLTTTTTHVPQADKVPDIALPAPSQVPETPALPPAPCTPGATKPAPGTPLPPAGVAAPGTPGDVSGLQLALLPTRTMANSSTHPTQYGQFRRFCERNHESCKTVVNSWRSLPQCEIADDRIL